MSNQLPKVVDLEIVKRFMSDEGLHDFAREYAVAKYGTDIPGSLSPKVINRMYTDEQLAWFIEQYEAHKKRHGFGRLAEPTREEREIASVAKRLGTYADTADEMQLPYHQVVSAVRKVSTYDFMRSQR